MSNSKPDIHEPPNKRAEGGGGTGGGGAEKGGGGEEGVEEGRGGGKRTRLTCGLVVCVLLLIPKVPGSNPPPVK